MIRSMSTLKINDKPYIVNPLIWSRRREEAYRRFVEDIEIGYVDRDIIDFIELIFRKKTVFSTSSCSGRITIVDAMFPWLRDEAFIVFKKHEPISSIEIMEFITRNTPTYRFWLIVSGPIIHLNALTLESAIRILSIARESGFKHSGIISISENGIIIEIISGVWTSFLLVDRSTPIVTDIQRIVDIANDILREGKARLQKLFNAFKELDI
ncbi:Protein of unknown function DUF207 [Ignisphaera aggregans DSM 17230]|uniref:tRNA(Phe) 7-((3-amino-3-carboxypropyl)-4-demethylwyosine(37)-N(4))-methyltransferase n=1 Tax=Ignisphaera aggregans (strain DSM 17230 / JCM 13409 / AQ1.S1) TaxID=583356 RepID=E0SPD6_IGNAA|nr:Protein of unknown function DUF207 [Ignisphaera aggregans DSM 17230]